jgi:hypothetical protein
VEMKGRSVRGGGGGGDRERAYGSPTTAKTRKKMPLKMITRHPGCGSTQSDARHTVQLRSGT